MFYGVYTTSNSGSDNGYEGEDDDSEENVVEVEQVEVIRSRRLLLRCNTMRLTHSGDIPNSAKSYGLINRTL